MEKIDNKSLFNLINQKEHRFVCLANDWFFYIENGHIYRFEAHHNTKTLDCFDDFVLGKIDESVLINELKQTLIKQIHYDWLTDVRNDTFLEQVRGASSELFLFTL